MLKCSRCEFLTGLLKGGDAMPAARKACSTSKATEDERSQGASQNAGDATGSAQSGKHEGGKVETESQVQNDAATVSQQTPNAEPAPTEGATATEGEGPAEPVVALPLKGLNVVRIIGFSIGLLIDQAWQKMGLVADPVSGKVERNMDEARLAIDTIALLLEHVKPHLASSDYDQIRQTLTTLRINFVEQTTKKSE